ncbi:MAG: hypothetical protein J7647_09065 [Cyanobacteria bacterium SBLK]|nr:hypothetical protein [Cyanobacteria bacterium SBLK]
MVNISERDIESLLEELWQDGSPICGEGGRFEMARLLARYLKKCDRESFGDRDILKIAKVLATQDGKYDFRIIGPLIEDYKYVVKYIGKHLFCDR